MRGAASTCGSTIEPPTKSALALALYLDRGGTDAGEGDDLPPNRRLLAALTAAGWARTDSPDCSPGPGQVCYFHAVGATHDELAWRERSWRFLTFSFPAVAAARDSADGAPHAWGQRPR